MNLIKIIMVFYIIIRQIIFSASQCIAEDLQKDEYENDDLPVFANILDQIQERNFHNQNDIDWIMLYAEQGLQYTVTLNSTSQNSNNIKIDLYNYNAAIKIQSFNQIQSISWQCDESSIYYLKLYCQSSISNSLPYSISIENNTNTDMYEQDNSIDMAKVIMINSPFNQYHWFHNEDDANKGDWSKFYGISNIKYKIKVENVGELCNPKISLFDCENQSLIRERDFAGTGQIEQLSFTAGKEGPYCIQIASTIDKNYSSTSEVSYELSLSILEALDGGTIAGFITDSCNGNPIEDIKIVTYNDNRATQSQLNGIYSISELNSGELIFKTKFSQQTVTYQLDETENKVMNIQLININDLNNDNQICLKDVIMGLKILSGFNYFSESNDVCVSISEIILMMDGLSEN